MALTGYVRIREDTKYEPFDFADALNGRVVGVRFEGLSFAIGLYSDADRIEAIDRFIDVLSQLRNDAADQMANAEFDTPLGLRMRSRGGPGIVDIDYLAAVQLVAGAETRAQYLAETRAPDDIVTLQAIGQCVRGVDALRAAFRFPSEAQLDAAHEAAVAEIDELADVEAYPGETRTPPMRLPWEAITAPLADWAPGKSRRLTDGDNARGRRDVGCLRNEALALRHHISPPA